MLSSSAVRLPAIKGGAVALPFLVGRPGGATRPLQRSNVHHHQRCRCYSYYPANLFGDFSIASTCAAPRLLGDRTWSSTGASTTKTLSLTYTTISTWTLQQQQQQQQHRHYFSPGTQRAFFSTTPRQLDKMAAKDYRLLCLENPLLDIQAAGDEALLQKYSLKPNDAILASSEHLSIYDDLLTNYNAKLIAGGAAQNTARGAQYILPANSVVYLGGVGDDKYAAILHDAVKAAGLRVEYRVDPEQPTGRCGVVITGHNRSMCTDLGAANHYDTDHLKKPEIWSLVEGAEAFYVGGYHFTVCPSAIMTLAKEAAEKNKSFILSLSAPFIPTAFKDPVDESAPYWDYVIGNETEAAAWADAHGESKDDLKEVAKKLANLPKVNGKRKRVAIVTQGTDPTLVATQGEDVIQEFPVHPIDKSLLNDTNGAGDAFAGGLVAGIIEGRPLKECIDMGQWLARLSIQELGPS
ncbi:putative adenosine kinase protein [Zalerion maritima]|uniref:adenosine kinase n=1 Tax=Zalerion maritima TaxID=339359 RepID=A0AAD5WRU8_9PEZI|nr:putative adenosine kinase protein [Zalerion maritima]